jgi:hypothetical protein
MEEIGIVTAVKPKSAIRRDIARTWQYVCFLHALLPRNSTIRARTSELR